MTVHLISGQDDAVRRSMAYALTALELADDQQLIDLTVMRPDRRARKAETMFQHTPTPLIDSWRSATVLERSTQPGDVVLISDRDGLGGVFALQQRSRPVEERRAVWTVAADSFYLEWTFVAATFEGFPQQLDSLIDWEITQYRWSDRVLATSPLAIEYLTRIGVDAELIVVPGDRLVPVGYPDADSVWAPDPVSRRAQTGEILRAMNSMERAAIAVSEEGRDDLVWTGTTWEALRHPRGVLGSRVSRSPGPPTGTTTVVIGDPFAVPTEETRSLRGSGMPLVVPEGSVGSQIWPDSWVWRGSDGLVATFEQPGDPPKRAVSTGSASPGPTPRSDPVSAISVGIPVFGDVRYLDECVASVLGQELQPVEVFILDDGSRSEEVDREMSRLATLDPRIKLMRSEHRGVCVARNLIMEEMSGDSFLMIDSDDLLQPGFLAKCARVLDSDDDLRAVATWTEFFGAYEGVEAKPPFDTRVGRRENPIISTGALVDMRVRDEGIRFAPDLAFLYCEDWHFWSQIVAAGGRFGLVAEPLVRHRVHPSSGGYLRTDLAHAIGRARATEPLN